VPRLSIVIPCVGGAADFDGTLVSVLQHRPADCQVLVVHTEPYDDPYRLTGEVDFLAHSGSSLTALINAALKEVRGEIVHVVGCGLEVTEGWTDAALAHFAEADVASVSPLVLGGDGSTIVSAGVRLTAGGRRAIARDRRLISAGAGRLRAAVQGPTLAAGFYRRDTLSAVDGFDESLGDTMADIDAALTMRTLGHLHVCEPASRLLQATDDLDSGAASGLAAGRAAERIFWRHCVDQGLALPLALHALVVAGSLIAAGLRFGAFAELLGRLAACAEVGAAGRYRQRLLAARQRLDELATLRTTIRMPVKAAASEAAVPRRRAA